MQKADLRAITLKQPPATISKLEINLRGRRNVTTATLLNKYKTSNRNYTLYSSTPHKKKSLLDDFNLRFQGVQGVCTSRRETAS